MNRIQKHKGEEQGSLRERFHSIVFSSYGIHVICSNSGPESIYHYY